MKQIQRALFAVVYLALFTSGCLSSVDKVTPATCIQNPFAKNIKEYPGKKELQIAYYAGDSFFTSSLDGREKISWVNGIYPLWSPDRKNIAYRETDSICVANDDGSQIRKLAHGENLSDLAWSPNAKFITYSALDNGKQYEIYIVSLAGEVTQLTFSSKADDGHPVWSPNGKEIAYVTYSDPIDTGGYIEYTVTISIVNVLNKQIRPVTHDGINPVWSPDGKQLLFESIDRKICVVDTNGTNKSCLTTGFSDYGQQWSPDGKKIAFTRIDKNWSIYTINADGSEQTWLANGIFPMWSLDGNQIAFSTGGKNPNLYVINSDGTRPILLAKNVWGYMWVEP